MTPPRSPAADAHPPLGPPRGFRVLAAVTSVATLAVIALGGAVRATDSGLACPDWPRCFGEWIPPAEFHLWMEHGHRLLAGAVGLAVLALGLWAIALRVRQGQRGLVWPAALAGVLIVVQSALGAFVVILLLQPWLVAAHLLMSLVVVACLLVLAVRAVDGPAAGTPPPTARRLRTVAWALAAAALAQATLGSLATGYGAAHVLTAVPLLADPAALAGVSTAPEWLHLVHRLAGWAVSGAMVWAALRAPRWTGEAVRAGADPRLAGLVRTALVVGGALAAAQVALGLGNVLTGAATLIAIGHLVVASWMVAVAALAGLLAGRMHAGEAPPADPDAAPAAEARS